jgi:thioredoxin-related protein
MHRIFHSLLLFTAVALSVHLASAQEQPAKGGVRFEHELSWTAIQAKAKAEHKYIFMDCFTTWCGPCRYMTTTIFPQKEMGDYFNDKFISVEVQLDTTSKDNDHVKSWYADAHALMDQYKVQAFPTYLVFTPEGQVIHRMVGSSATTGEFIAKVRNSFDSTKQYYTQMNEYEAGRRDSAFLRRLTLQSAAGYDMNNVRTFGAAYLHTQTDLLQPGVLDIVLLCTLKTKDEYFDFLVQHVAEFDKMKGPGKAEARIREIILGEGTGIHPNEKREPKWDSLQKAIAAKVPAPEADELMARIKLNFYLGRSDWANFEPAMVSYMKTYGKQIDDNDLNTVA